MTHSEAIQALSTSDPKFHAEITAGHPVKLTEEDEEDRDIEDDEDGQIDELSIADVAQAIMASSNAVEAFNHLNHDSESSDLDDEDSIHQPELTCKPLQKVPEDIEPADQCPQHSSH
ncbi:hypothetical protein FRC11_013029 [Ceratobasidium sp. 423]|nr:hypothetical protein FRC11_013029 [Ceratobasidium sp. 423]